MKDLAYVFRHFFTHKDYLPPADQLPGTLFTPLSFVFEAVLLAFIFSAAWYLKKHPEKIKKVFTVLWVVLLILEVAIVTWDSLAGRINRFDLTINLSLYPCSIFLYALPFVIWGRGAIYQMACGYICTLGLLGASYNFLLPTSKLTDYSCFSFPAFHTFFYHGSMLFVFLVLVFSGMHCYTNVSHWKQLLYPSVFSLIVSVPANIVNYSAIDADYMYFKGRYPWLSSLFGNTPEVAITLILYVLYVFIPALFYLPSYLANKKACRLEEYAMIKESI